MPTRIAVKETTEEELAEYFDFIETYSVECPWTKEQAELIGAAFRHNASGCAAVLKLVEAIVLVGIHGAMLSSMVMGFQCGREFENRLMAKAMRGKDL